MYLKIVLVKSNLCHDLFLSHQFKHENLQFSVSNINRIGSKLYVMDVSKPLWLSVSKSPSMSVSKPLYVCV